MVSLYHHNIPEMEFSGVFDISVNVNHDRITIHEPIIFLKYFMFIKFENNIYIDIKYVGSIIMPFEELMKNKLLKMYYELSLLLVENKNEIIEQTGYSDNDAKITNIYVGRRHWCIDCAYFYENIATNIKEVQKKQYYCYYDINPYEMFEVDVSTKASIERFNYNFKVRLGYLYPSYDKIVISYMNRVIDYKAALIEKELDEISAIQDTELNIIKLIAFNEKKGMNCDIFQVIYNNFVSANEAHIYAPYLANM